MKLELVLPLPPKNLNPHVKTHWGVKHKATKQYKMEVNYALREERHSHIPFLVSKMQRVRISYTFYNGRKTLSDGRYRPYDQENGIACMKPAVDALVDRAILKDDTQKYVEIGGCEIIQAKANKIKRAEVIMLIEEAT